MHNSVNRIVWRQFGAAIDMLDDAIKSCPPEFWRFQLYDTGARNPMFAEFWYLAYHAIFWLDLYLTGSEDGFLPPESFLLIEQTWEGPLPEEPYTKEQLRGYLGLARGRCRETLASLTDDAALRLCQLPWGEVSFLELQLYSMRHMQEHASELALALGQQTGSGPEWIGYAGEISQES